jgi:hypothetical protein
MPKIRKSTSLKAAAVALGVAGIVGLTISSAASLNLAGGSVGAGTSVVAACQPAATPITVGFTTAYSATAPGYTVTSVKLGAIDAACAGKSINVTLQGASNASLVEVTGTAAAGTVTITVPGTIAATSVVGTAVVIYN